MAMKEYSTFPKAPGLEPRSSNSLMPYTGPSLVKDGLPLCRGAVGVFYSPSRLGEAVRKVNKYNYKTKRKVINPDALILLVVTILFVRRNTIKMT